MSSVKLAHQLSISVAVLLVLTGCGGPSAPQTSSVDAATPFAIAVDGAGNVYVTDPIRADIQKFDSAGQFLLKWGSEGTANGEFRNNADVAVDQQGNVYVSDTDNHRIQQFDSMGTFLAKWTSSGAGDGKFLYPDEVAVDKEGFIYVGEEHGRTRMQKFRPR